MAEAAVFAFERLSPEEFSLAGSLATHSDFEVLKGGRLDFEDGAEEDRVPIDRGASQGAVLDSGILDMSTRRPTE